jgi:hypothetical protein
MAAARLVRIGAPLVVTLALAVGGCGGPSPDAACEPPQRTPVVDEEHGFSICLAGNWRDLRPGDPAWVEIYGEAMAETEQRVASGTMARFAVPLRPRDADTAANMAVYVRDNVQGQSTAEAGEGYLETARGADATDLAVALIDLPVGEVAELSGTIPNDISDVPSIDWLNAFVIATPEQVFYVLFRCDRGSKAVYEDRFQGFAATFKLTTGASSSPPASGAGSLSVARPTR